VSLTDTRVHNFDEIIDRRGTDAKKYDPSIFPQDVLPMWIADTDFKCPEPLVEKVVKRAEHGLYGYPYNQQTFGKAAQRWMKRRFDWDIDQNWVEYVPGVIPGIIFAMRALSEPGDGVIIQTPVYPPFYDLVQNNGRTLLKNSLLLKDGKYFIDFDDLESKLQDKRTKILLLSNPHNPSGRVFTDEELIRMGNMCLEHNVFVISDEIHSDLVFKGYRHIPFASINDRFAQNSIACINPSKTFNTAGFRTAALIIPNKAVKEKVYSEIVSNKAYGRTIFGPLAFETVYNECEYYVDQMMEYLQQSLELTVDYFEKYIPNIKLIKPEATYLLWLDCRGLNMEQDELERFMVEKAKIGLNSGTTFGEEGKGFMRMNIACPRAKLVEALERLAASTGTRYRPNSVE
jgi:cystathionine beta-lyase